LKRFSVNYFVTYSALFLLFTFNGLAQSLSLEQAIAMAQKSNHEIKIAAFEKEIRQLELKTVEGQHYGTLDIINRFTRSNDALNVFGFKLQSREAGFKDFGFAEFDTTNPNILHVKPRDLNFPSARNHAQTSIEYKLPLYTGGKLEHYAHMKQTLIRLASLDKQAIVSEKIHEIKKIFHTMALLRTYTTNLRTIKQTIQRLERLTQTMREEGYAKHIDLLEVQTKKADIARKLNQSNADKTLLLHFLSHLLDHTVKEIQPPEEVRYDISINKTQALQNNISIKKAEEALKLSRLNQKVQDAALLPQVALFAQYGLHDNTFFPDVDKHDAYTVGIEMRWNLFNGGIDSANQQKAKIAHMKAQQQLAMAQSGIALKFANIKTQISHLDFDIQSLQKELELARAIYENYLGRYQENIVSINDVLIKHSEEIAKVLELKTLQNERNDHLFALEKLANGVTNEAFQ
jgi:outer membrane protein TolC